MIKAVVGANWGDEGKGKITDMLAEKADIIVRFQGGANAGPVSYTHLKEVSIRPGKADEMLEKLTGEYHRSTGS